MSEQNIPTSHKIISILAIIWNIFGVMSFIGHSFFQEAASAGLNEAQQAYMESYPTWGYLIFGTAVTTGLLGAIGLLMKKSWTTMLFTISLIAIIINQFYPILFTDYMEVFGSGSIWLPIIITLIGVALLIYAKGCEKKGWLH